MPVPSTESFSAIKSIGKTNSNRSKHRNVASLKILPAVRWNFVQHFKDRLQIIFPQFKYPSVLVSLRFMSVLKMNLAPSGRLVCLSDISDFTVAWVAQSVDEGGLLDAKDYH